VITTLPTVIKSGSLNILENAGPVQTCTGVCFTFLPNSWSLCSDCLTSHCRSNTEQLAYVDGHLDKNVECTVYTTVLFVNLSKTVVSTAYGHHQVSIKNV
jgi:hypothetical protein